MYVYTYIYIYILMDIKIGVGHSKKTVFLEYIQLLPF